MGIWADYVANIAGEVIVLYELGHIKGLTNFFEKVY